jgi:very-short-patch-repair endonuclease
MRIVHGTDVFAELVNLSFHIAQYESPMNKKEFLLRQIAKTNKKNYENYVVTRVIHKLDDPTVKFITQQYVSRPERRRALTDLYIPQIAFHVEIDEGHHKNIVEVDMVREADIIDATGHTIVRVDATLPLDN